MANWNQPICDGCWPLRLLFRGEAWKPPVKVKDADWETCAYCGRRTASGIYVREHPDKVPYPAVEGD